MTQSKLGLPFEYQQFPEYFDALNVNDTTQDKNALIESLLKKNKVRTVLDMTCGTGSQVFYLAKRGYQVMGSDFSPELLTQARKKAKVEKVPVKFIDGDMRTIQLGRFDAVITIFNAIGHLTKSSFEKALKNIRSHLPTGGIYVFDILNLEMMSDKTVADLSYHVHKKYKDSQLYTVQCSMIDRNKGLLTSFNHIITQKKAEKPKLVEQKCALQIYTAKELQDMLSRHGFETLAQYDMDGKKFIKNKSLSILTVARAIEPKRFAL